VPQRFERLTGGMTDFLMSAIALAAAWGAAGGMTNVLATKMTAGDAIRHVLLGALIAAGSGPIWGPVIAHWMGAGFPTDMGVGVSCFLSGAFGASVFERVRAFIRRRDVQDDEKPAD